MNGSTLCEIRNDIPTNKGSVFHEKSTSLPFKLGEDRSSLLSATKKQQVTREEPKPLPLYFADRYQDEIASTAKIGEYKALGEKYKSILLKEAKELQVRFSKDLQVANNMESTVNGISTMLTEFVSIIQAQSDIVEDVHQAAVDTTDQVKLADDELMLTLERSQSHSRNMAFLTVGLGLLLLLLDWVTP